MCPVAATVSPCPGPRASSAARTCRTNVTKFARCVLGIGSKSMFTPSTRRHTTASAISRANVARRVALESSAIVASAPALVHANRATERWTFVFAACAYSISVVIVGPVQLLHADVSEPSGLRLTRWPYRSATTLKYTMVETTSWSRWSIARAM